MIQRTRNSWLLGALAIALVSTTAEARKYPDTTEEGLQRVKDSNMQAVYLAPDADLTGYSKIMLDTADVAFKKDWQRNIERSSRTRVSESDMARIRESLAADFDAVFRKELSEGGYELVDSAGEDVLRISPSIVDLYVNAPDLRQAGRVDSYTERAGYMTLNLDLHDSSTGQLIARGIDRREDPRRGYAQWTTSVSNKAAADRILKRWAKTLREGLDEATQLGGS